MNIPKTKFQKQLVEIYLHTKVYNGNRLVNNIIRLFRFKTKQFQNLNF